MERLTAEREAQIRRWREIPAITREMLDDLFSEIDILRAERNALLEAAIAKLRDCRESGDCADAALMPGECCSDECAALAIAVDAARKDGN